MAYNLMPSPWFTALDANGNPIAGALLHTFEAGGTTPKVTYSDAAGTENANPVVCDGSGRATVRLGTGAYRLVLHDADDVAVPGADEDNVIGYRGLESLDVDTDATFGEAVTAGQLVYLSDGDGGRNAGQWYKASSDLAYSQMLAVGFAVSAAASGAVGQVRRVGVVTGLSGLAAGTKYYVSGTAGALSANAGGRLVGIGLSTTTLLVGVSEPPLNALGDLIALGVYGTGGPPTPVDGAYATNGAYGTLLTAASLTVVHRIVLCNPTATARTCYVVIVEAGGTAAIRHAIFYDTIRAEETVVLDGPWYLDANDFIQVQASAASAIAVRIERTATPRQPDGFTLVVTDGVLITSSWATILTAAGVRAVVNAVTLTNTDTVSLQPFVEIVPSGGSQAANQSVWAQTLLAGESVVIPGPFILEVGDMLRAYCATTNKIAIRVTATQEN